MALKESLAGLAKEGGTARGFAGGARTGRTVVPNRFDARVRDVASRRLTALKEINAERKGRGLKPIGTSGGKAPTQAQQKQIARRASKAK